MANEIKKLCSNIATRNFYDWQARDIMERYYQVSLMEQLTKDLSKIAFLIKEKQWNDERKREYRFWLGLQLKLFESFFNTIVGMEEKNKDKIQSVTKKSNEILRRFSSDKDFSSGFSFRAFYRVTENIETLLS